MRYQYLPLVAALLAGVTNSQSTLSEIFGSIPHAFGRSCDIVGDLDGDGRDDFLVSSPFEPNGTQIGAGAVRVYSGANASVLLQVRGQFQHHLGLSAKGAGDLNGDGKVDLLCATPDFDRIDPVTQLTLLDCGRVLAISGADGSVLVELVGLASGDKLGTSVAGAGDLDGDGRDDFVVGAPGAEWNGSPSNSGAVRAWSWANGELWTLSGTSAGSQLGSDVSSAGDVTGDGHPDVLAAPVRLIDGATGVTLTYLFNGTALAGGVDFNLDGVSDYVVGWSNFSSGAGRVRVLSGADATTLFELQGSGDQGVGTSVAVTPDVDADGVPDFVFGAPGWDTPLAPNGGAVCVHSGRDGSLIRFFPGTVPAARVGTSVGAGGDMNQDGWPDIVASGVGVAYAFSVLPTGVTPLGVSTGDCLGPLRLMGNGTPSVGNADFALHTHNVLPGHPSFLVVSQLAVPGGAPFLGMQLFVGVPPPGGFISLVQAPNADANGSVVAPMPVPADPGLSGKSYATQSFHYWPQAPCGPGWSSTNGLLLQIP